MSASGDSRGLARSRNVTRDRGRKSGSRLRAVDFHKVGISRPVENSVVGLRTGRCSVERNAHGSQLADRPDRASMIEPETEGAMCRSCSRSTPEGHFDRMAKRAKRFSARVCFRKPDAEDSSERASRASSLAYCEGTRGRQAIAASMAPARSASDEMGAMARRSSAESSSGENFGSVEKL